MHPLSVTKSCSPANEVYVKNPLKLLLKAVVVSVLLIFATGRAYSQVATAYTFSQGTVATNPASTSTANVILGGYWDDDVASFTFPAGFVFNFNGTNYTSCYVNSNGYITFGGTAPGAASYSAISSNTGYAGAFCPWAEDLADYSNAPISYSITGTAPNRVLSILWVKSTRYTAWVNIGQENGINFSINMYETSNTIEVAYGNCSMNTTQESAQIGLRGTSNADFNHRNLNANSAWLNNTTTAGNNGQSVRTKNNAKPSNLYTFFRWTPSCVPPAITTVTANNPTTCGGTGSLVITGTSLSGNYTVTYTSSVAGTVTTAAIAAAANTVTVTGLAAATYTNISIKAAAASCSSNVLAGPYTISNPAAPVITTLSSTNPTTCGGSNGTLIVNGTALAGNYTVTYTSSVAGTVTTAAIAAAANTVTVTGLPAATYTNVSIKSSTTLCNSNTLAGPVILTNPTAPSITSLSSTNPTTCGGSNGTLIVNGTALSGSYTVTYTSSIAGTITTAAIASVANTVTVTGLPAATYTNVSIKSSTTLCNSNVLAGPVILSNPATPVITTLSSANPTTCGGNSGTITITATSLSGNYTVTYTSSITGTVTTAPIASAANTVTVTGLPAATYTNFNITSSTTLCNSNSLPGPLVLTDPPGPSVTGLSATNTTACGASDGTIIISAVSLSGSYTVTYTSSVTGTTTTAAIAAVANTVTITGLPAASYTNVSIKSSSTLCNSNIAPGPVVISDPAPPVISGTSFTNTTACGASDGTFTIQGLQANTAYSFFYNNAVVPVPIVTDALGNYTETNLPAGNYVNVYVIKTNCVSNSVGPITISDPAPPFISGTTFSATTSCGGSDGSFTVQGLLPNTAYALYYNNAVVPVNIVTTAGGTYTVTNLPSGIYTNIYVIRIGCTSNTIASVTIPDPNPPVISGSSSGGPTTCNGTNGFVSLQGLLANASYNVSYDNGVTTFTPTIISDPTGNVLVTNLPAGTYNNFTVTINNCVSNSIGPITITDPNPPVITAVTNAPICEGQTLTLSSSVTVNGNPAVGSSYSWTGPAFVNPVNQANIAIPNVPASATGTYTVTTTIANCTSAPFMLPVTVYAAPAAPAYTVNTPLCSGNDLHLDVTSPDPNLTYIWSGPGLSSPDTTTNAAINNAQSSDAGVYDLSVVNSLGCGLVVPSSVNVVINQTPGTPVPVDVVYCQTDVPVALSATPSGNPADTLKWYTVPTGGQGSTTAPIPSTATAGTFIWYVAQTSQPGCEGARVPQNVWVKQKPTAPTATTPDYTYCQLDNTAIPLSATGDSLQWYTVAVGGTPSSAAPTPSTATPGLFTWYVSQTIDGCESNRLPITVTVIPKPLPPVTKAVNYCQYDSAIALSATGQNLKWYDVPAGGAPLAAAPVPSTAIPAVTTWYVSQTVNGCESDRAALLVTVNFKPTAGISTSRDEVCQGDTLLITYVGNGTNTTTYDWSWPAGVNIFSGTGQGPYTVQFNNIGTINITLVASENGCFSPLASHTVKVKQSPNVKIGLRSNIVCTDDPAYIEITYLDMEVNNYLWTFNGAHTSSGATEETGKGPYYLSWSQPGTYVVSLDIIAKDQCWSQAQQTVVVHERPEAKISASVTDDICTGDDVTLSASVNNSRYTYKWLPAQLFDYDYNSPVVKVHADKTTYVSLEVTNEYGCSSMDSVMLHTKTCCEILLPTAFSPNGDGKNDLFRIINPGRHKLESLKVYNRFGQEVFTTSNEKEGWNGSYNGVAQDMGVYQYMVKYICEGKETYLKGDVTLVR